MSSTRRSEKDVSPRDPLSTSVDNPNRRVILSYDSYMVFQLNFKSGKAVYLQLVDQVKLAAAAGTLHAGEPLPPIRPLAEDLRVNRNTVAKAYAELERQGVIETIVGKGCFVRENNSPFRKDDDDQVPVESHSPDDRRDQDFRTRSGSRRGRGEVAYRLRS